MPENTYTQRNGTYEFNRSERIKEETWYEVKESKGEKVTKSYD